MSFFGDLMVENKGSDDFWKARFEDVKNQRNSLQETLWATWGIISTSPEVLSLLRNNSTTKREMNEKACILDLYLTSEMDRIDLSRELENDGIKKASALSQEKIDEFGKRLYQILIKR